MLKIGLSSCSKTLDERFFEDCAAAGIAAVELSPGDTPETLDYPALARFADAAGVALWSLHLPFMPFDVIDVSALNKEMRKKSVERNRALIERAADAGVGVFVLHASGEPIPDAERAERFACAEESVSALARTAAACGGVLAVEDLPRTCLGRNSEEMLRLTAVDPNAKICFDTNHLLGEPIQDFIRAVGDKIVTTHVSDYDFIDEKHWLPGEGSIDWQALYQTLLETGYRGPWLYELGFASPRTRRRCRDLTCADFVKNANEIFTGQPLTVLPTV